MDQNAEAIDLIKASGLFDAEWYRNRYPDVALLSIDPVRHYLKLGALLHRDPSPNFSTLGYLQAYPDVESSGLNPLYHYVKQGRQEGRIAPLSKTAWQHRPASCGAERDSQRSAMGGMGTEASNATSAEPGQELTKFRSKCQQLTEENELLLLQLHQVQEELEEYFMKYRELCSRSDAK